MQERKRWKKSDDLIDVVNIGKRFYRTWRIWLSSVMKGDLIHGLGVWVLEERVVVSWMWDIGGLCVGMRRWGGEGRGERGEGRGEERGKESKEEWMNEPPTIQNRSHEISRPQPHLPINSNSSHRISIITRAFPFLKTSPAFVSSFLNSFSPFTFFFLILFSHLRFSFLFFSVLFSSVLFLFFPLTPWNSKNRKYIYVSC